MYYIVGLGNPGEEYANTRHNIGWLALDAFIKTVQLPEVVSVRHASGRVSEGVVGGTSVTVLYPDTFMNHSGTAVRKLVDKGAASSLVVIYDDVDIPLGDIKVSFGRGSGGHNGVESIMKSLDTKDFIRVRIGVAKTGFWPWEKGQVKRPAGGEALSRHVLGKFSRRESDALTQGLERTTAALRLILTDGYVKAMNQYN